MSLDSVHFDVQETVIRTTSLNEEQHLKVTTFDLCNFGLWGVVKERVSANRHNVSRILSCCLVPLNQSSCTYWHI